jgi:hypothetical protein
LNGIPLDIALLPYHPMMPGSSQSEAFKPIVGAAAQGAFAKQTAAPASKAIFECLA